MTILTARVEPQRVSDLEAAYRQATTDVPADIVETFLAREPGGMFRIVTVWVSREALEKIRASGIKPKGVQVFEAAGATPALSIADVIAHHRAS